MAHRGDAESRVVRPANIGYGATRVHDFSGMARSSTNAQLTLMDPHVAEIDAPFFLDELDQRHFLGARPVLPRYRLPRSPVRLNVVADALVVGPKFVVVDATGHVYRETFWHPDNLRDGDHFHPVADQSGLETVEFRPDPFSREIDETFLLGLPWAHNYHHWLHDCLARLWFRDFYPELATIPALIPPLEPFQRQSLELFGLSPDECVPHRRQTSVGRLWIASHGDYCLSTTHWLRDKLRAAVATRAGTKARRLYVSRAKATSRRLINEDAVARELERRGFERVELEDLPVRDQIAMFAEASVVVGPHGAGLTNTLATAAGAWLVELHPGDEVNYVYWLQAGVLGLRYAFLAGSPPVGPRDFTVDAQRLGRLLDRIERA